MSDRRSQLHGRVTLEDLLRLKRAERPPAEFWKDFEDELRQRQLAALVEKKTWWREAATGLGRIRGLRLPLGATAVFALTLLSVHRYAQSVSEEPRAILAPPARPAMAAVALPARGGLAAVPRPAVERVSAPVERSPGKTEAPAPATEATAMSSGEVSGIIPWLGDIALDRIAATDTAVLARPGAVNLSSVPAVMDSALASGPAAPLGFEDRAMPAMRRRPTADVLPTATAAAVPRRARLLAMLDSVGASSPPEASAPEHVRRSATRYLMQDDGERSLGRREAEGVGLSIRF